MIRILILSLLSYLTLGQYVNNTAVCYNDLDCDYCCIFDYEKSDDLYDYSGYGDSGRCSLEICYPTQSMCYGLEDTYWCGSFGDSLNLCNSLTPSRDFFIKSCPLYCCRKLHEIIIVSSEDDSNMSSIFTVIIVGALISMIIVCLFIKNKRNKITRTLPRNLENPLYVSSGKDHDYYQNSNEIYEIPSYNKPDVPLYDVPTYDTPSYKIQEIEL